MKRLIVAAFLVSVAVLPAVPARADTLTGSYAVTFSDPGTTTTVTDNLLPSGFSLTTGAPRSLFVTVNPGTCSSSCFPNTGTISVTFSNLMVNGHNFGGFTETGVFTANYATQTDSVVWAGATNQGSVFGLDQDGSIPLVFTKTLNGGASGVLSVNMIDGADWNVQTWVEAGLTAAVPGPLAGAGLPGLVAGCFSLLGLAWRRRKQNNPSMV